MNRTVQQRNWKVLICANRERDMRMRLTSAGPHRDDLCVMANGIDIRKYGSQGQQSDSGTFT